MDGWMDKCNPFPSCSLNSKSNISGKTLSLGQTHDLFITVTTPTPHTLWGQCVYALISPAHVRPGPLITHRFLLLNCRPRMLTPWFWSNGIQGHHYQVHRTYIAEAFYGLQTAAFVHQKTTFHSHPLWRASLPTTLILHCREALYLWKVNISQL